MMRNYDDLTDTERLELCEEYDLTPDQLRQVLADMRQMAPELAHDADAESEVLLELRLMEIMMAETLGEREDMMTDAELEALGFPTEQDDGQQDDGQM